MALAANDTTSKKIAPVLNDCVRKKLGSGCGSGCGSVGRAVAFDTRGPRFESSHRQKIKYILNICLL